MKTLSNFGDFTGSRIRISNSGGTSKRIENLNQPLKKTTANHLSVISKSNTEIRLKISGLRNNLQYHRRLPEWSNKHFEEGFSEALQN
jgi:hypothetical protein